MAHDNKYFQRKYFETLNIFIQQVVRYFYLDKMESVFVTRRTRNIFWETMLDKKIVFKNLATFTYKSYCSGRSTCFVISHCIRYISAREEVISKDKLYFNSPKKVNKKLVVHVLDFFCQAQFPPKNCVFFFFSKTLFILSF